MLDAWSVPPCEVEGAHQDIVHQADQEELVVRFLAGTNEGLLLLQDRICR